MLGPAPKGTWTASAKPQSYAGLAPGCFYQVARPFHDYDGNLHRAGERWRFLTSNFLPYDDGLSLIVALDEDHEWHIRLQARPEQQEDVVHRLDDYIAPVFAGVPDAAAIATAAREPRFGRSACLYGGGGVGAAAGLFIGIAILPAAGLPGVVVLIPMLAVGLIGGISARRWWRRQRLRALQTLLAPGLEAGAVEHVLGQPAANLDLFPGPPMARWIYPPETRFRGTALGIRLAVDFDAKDRILGLDSLR